MKEYQIVEHSVIVGRFTEEHHRNFAFDEYFLKQSRSGYIKDEMR